MNNKKAKRLRKIVKASNYEKVASTTQERTQYQELKELYKNKDITLK